MNKKILGLDLGTNSIGWALIGQDFETKNGNIIGMGSRIIPMSQDILGEFGKGNSVSQTAERTGFRGVRRIRERYLLRRERLHRVLHVLGYLPAHFAAQIDFEKNLGQFFSETEPKLAYDKNDFIFKTSFQEMLEDFKKSRPQHLDNNKKVPYDWTLYYLRKKALTQKIAKEELAWILLNFNQKRGYYQLRGEEEEENPNKLVEFHSLKIVEVKADETQKGKPKIWYSLILENGWVYRRPSKTPLFDWKEKVRDFIVTTDLNDDGSVKTDKDGIEKRSFRAPGENDWTLVKKKTEQEIEQSTKTVGAYIYDTLLQNPKQKIKGKLVRTIERKFYKEELKQILTKQKELHAELQDETIYNAAVRELYRNNDAHQITLSRKDFVHLFLEDIIFYQRPLKSKKSSVSNCTLEHRSYKDAQGIEQIAYLKAIPKSHPLYQEFRIWQWMYNLHILKQDDDKHAVTAEYLNTIEDYESLFTFLNNRKEVDQKALLKHFKLTEKTHRWNFVEDKKFPCNETKTLITTRLAKVENVPDNFLTAETEQQLWHLIYSVTDKTDYEKALKTFAEKHNLDVASFVDHFKKIPPFESNYGSFSEKAIKKLLPLMRLGKYWNEESLVENLDLYFQNIEKLLSGISKKEGGITDSDRIKWNKSINNKLRDELENFKNAEITSFQGLRLHIAQYLVYGRHSEAGITEKWQSPADLEKYLEDFKQHSLRNPIVEQIITETLRVVKDIWVKYGKGARDFFNEIHIELGREMKNTADDRKKISEQTTANENTNLRIKALLAELSNDKQIENVRPYSPMQQEILKIYEDGVLNSGIEIDEDILKISKTAEPSGSDLQRYKLWLEQKYRSPYTGQMIPLSRLFTPEYEIEHIIPQSRFFDDSFSNKVICEAAVNKLKDNQIGLEFIKNHHGQIVETGFGKTVKIFEEEEYEAFVKEHYTKNRGKRSKLMMDDIPEKMIERQINDTRYISKFISSVLSNVVRNDSNDDGINSINVLPGNGKITSILKQDWGLNDVWNDLILPRFERMNAISNSTAFTTYNEKFQKYLPTVPLELSKGFQKKRIDHRHHALDALVIACATRDHINLLNNQSAKSDVKRYDLQHKLRRKEPYFNEKENRQKDAFKEFYKPWETFTEDARNELEKIIVSFKQNLRVINKTTNKSERWVVRNGIKVKELVHQEKGDSWAIRKPMHQETVAGLIKLRKQKTVSLNIAIDEVGNITDKGLRTKIKQLLSEGCNKKQIAKFFKDIENKWDERDVSKVNIYYWEVDKNGEGTNAASRVSLDNTFNEKKIESITDSGIQKILLNHLNRYRGRLDEKGNEMPAELLAFSPEGIEEMNKNIVALNNGKFHQPILKVRTYEPKGNKFNVGQSGNKKDKFVIAAKGTNLFFAIYQDEKGKRNYETIPLNEVIDHQKWRATLPKEEQRRTPMIPVKPENGTFLFSLSPNDLVYMPTDDEREHNLTIDFFSTSEIQPENIYKVVSFTGNQCFFVKQNIATTIVNKVEYSALNKMEKSVDGRMIKESCIKLKVDRLGCLSKL